MLKFQSGWKPACKFENKRPIEDENNNASMESTETLQGVHSCFQKEKFSKNLRKVQTMEAKYKDLLY